MENQETFYMLDELGQEKEARILNVVEINQQEYIVYAINKNEEEDSIFVEKLVRDQKGEENIIPIEEEEEKRIVFEEVRKIIDQLD